MSEDIEVPKRGYDTKDVETMTKEHEASGGGRGKRILVIVVLLVAIVTAIWLIVGR